jgi:hypothetical protein
MNRKTIILILLFFALVGLAVYLSRDAFRREPIQIAYSLRPAPPQRQAVAQRRTTPSGKRGYILTFALDQKTTLESIQVFQLSDALTNRYPHPIWELVAETNSPPLKSFDYGVPVRGMKPKVRGAFAEPLQPGQSYRVVVHTGSETAQRDFQMPP